MELLRDYQQQAVGACHRFFQEGKGRAAVIAAPTGSGKSHLIADMAQRAVAKGRRVLVLTHRAPLLQQNRAKVVAADPALEFQSSFFCAGLHQKDLDAPAVFASVQSLARRNGLPAFDLVLVDEAHLVPPLDVESQYRACINAIRAAQQGREPAWVGLTATPYRTGTGYLWEPPGALWDGLCYEIDMLSLVERGYLAPLVTVTPEAQIDEGRLVKRRGEFTTASLESATAPLVDAIAKGAWTQFVAEGRRGMMVFCASLALVDQFEEAFHRLGVADVTSVTGDDVGQERQQALDAFKGREARIIVSCGVLCEGFDAPHADLVVVARAMASPGLWVQICGRGMRICEGKSDCVIRDHGGNLERLGPVNAVQPVSYYQRGRRAGEGEGEGGEQGEREVRLTLDPSRGRLLVDGAASEESFQRVVGCDVRVTRSAAGNDMLELDFELEGRPNRVRQHIVIRKAGGQRSKPRSWHGRRYSRLCGEPLHVPEDQGGDATLAERTRALLRRIRRVSCRMQGRWPEIAHVEVAAGAGTAG